MFTKFRLLALPLLSLSVILWSTVTSFAQPPDISKIPPQRPAVGVSPNAPAGNEVLRVHPAQCAVLHLSHPVNSLVFSADGKLLISGGGIYNKSASPPGELKVWDVGRRELLADLKGHDLQVTSVAISADGKTVASGSNDNAVILWDILTRKAQAQLKDEKQGEILAVAFHPGGKVLAAANWNGFVSLWNLNKRQVEKRLVVPKLESVSVTLSQTQARFSSDGQTLMTGGSLGDLHWWDPEKGVERQNAWLQSAGVWALAASPDGKLLATAGGGKEKGVALWDPHTGKTKQNLEAGGGNVVHALAFSPDGRFLAVESKGEAIELWDVKTGHLLATLTGHSAQALAFSPDGKLLASGGDDATIRLWDLTKVKELQAPLSKGER